MIRPVAFHMNEQTAVNNFYQKAWDGGTEETIQEKALMEFEGLVSKLKEEGVEVSIFDDTPDPATPDSIFPNNWVSFHEDGMIRLYPMFAPNRRAERRDNILAKLKKNFKVMKVKSYAQWEDKKAYLEGTGSLLLDRQNNIAYAALSDRTMEDPLNAWCDEIGYKAVTFHANQTVSEARLPIYHTNVMMALGEKFAVVCMDCIDDDLEKERLEDSLADTGKEIIEITEEQVEQFAGNMIQVESKDGNRLIVMSSAAYHSLDRVQIRSLSAHGKLIYADLKVIEMLGGGSARCMMSEVFLPKKN
ncbi:MAG: amidinotransferase [Cytophagales bacterium]|nr:amidinotransferase [Cytophagales bacterium]